MTRKEWRNFHYETKHKPTFQLFIKFYPFTLENLDGEDWADIEGYEGRYQISTFGRVKSLKGRWGESKILKPQISTNGYLRIELNKIGKAKKFFIHCLVAQAFIPRENAYLQINHRDGNKFNNFTENLEWVTASENQRHALQMGLRFSGEEHPDAKLTNAQVLYIRQNPDNLSQYKLAEKFGVAQPTIEKILLGQVWKSVGGIIHKPKWQRPRISDTIREQIRAEYIKGSKECGCRSLAKKYGVDPTTVCNIIHEK